MTAWKKPTDLPDSSRYVVIRYRAHHYVIGQYYGPEELQAGDNYDWDEDEEWSPAGWYVPHEYEDGYVVLAGEFEAWAEIPKWEVTK